MKRFIIFLFIGGFLLCVFFVCRGFIKSKQEKEKFVKYAISKQDFEILSDLGYCDETGQKDEKRVPFRDKILQNAYLENQDITYLEYSKYLKNISPLGFNDTKFANSSPLSTSIPYGLSAPKV